MNRTQIRSASPGFSIVELMLALAIGFVLLGITVRAMAPVRQASAVRSGDFVVRSMLSRARAEAIERNETVLMRLDPTGDTAWIQAGTDQVDRFDFHEELGVNVLAAQAVTICMTARGVADANCNYPLLPMIGLRVGGKSTYLQVLPSGQIITP